MSNSEKPSLYFVFQQLRKILNKKIKFLLVAVVVIGISASLLEVAAIGTTLKFLQAVREASGIVSSGRGNDTVIGGELTSALMLGVGLILVINVSAGIRLFSLWFNDKIAANIANYTAGLIFGSILNMDFERIKLVKSGTVLTTLTVYHVELVYTINNTIQLCSATIMAIGILATITIITPILTMVSIILIGGAYALIAFTIRKKANKNSYDITYLVEQQIISIQEAWGDIRNIILGNQQVFYMKEFTRVDKHVRSLKLQNSIFGFMPRFIMEALGISIIALFSMSCIYFRASSADVLALVGAFALGTIRLLPYVQNIYSRVLDLKLNRPGTLKALEYIPVTLIDKKHSGPCPKFDMNREFEFSNLTLENVSWSYDDRTNNIFEGINLCLKKGEALGLSGKSGSGKTTLVDIMIGLLKPKIGSVYVNGCNIWDSRELRVNYMNSIHYVNQSIYIKDVTLGCFIANGTAEEKVWDIDRLIACIEMAGIGHLLKETEVQLNRKLGENASSLSGGERQRLAIARALYLKPSILVLDEPTSALDKVSERKVVDALRAMKEYSTIILISHKQEPHEICDELVDMERLNRSNI